MLGNALIKPESHELTPAYVWKESRAIRLTFKEKIVAKTFLKTRSYEACSRALKEAGFNRKAITCERWLHIPTVVQYLKERLEASGIKEFWKGEEGEANWLMIMTKHLQGIERLKGGDLYAMKLIAEVCGFGEAPILNFNQSIEVVQQNGKP